MNIFPVGSKFGQLTLIENLDLRGAGNHRLARWSCDCGLEKIAAVSRVKNGSTKSCGCLSRKGATASHGMRKSSEYSSWRAMKHRCLNPSAKDYRRYGARGIGVHPSWVDSFQAFLSHIGRRPKGTSIDRIDPAKGYIPGNVRWSTPAQQARNRTDLVSVTTEDGERIALVDFAARLGITKGAAHLRFKRQKLEGIVYED